MRTGKKGLRRFAAAICAVALCASMMPTSGLALEGDASTDSDAALVQTQEEVETAPSAALTDGEEQTGDPQALESPDEPSAEDTQAPETPDEPSAEDLQEPDTSGESSVEDPQNLDDQAPAEASVQDNWDRSAVATLSNDAGTYANGKELYTVLAGSKIEIQGYNQGLFMTHSWTVTPNDKSVSILKLDVRGHVISK